MAVAKLWAIVVFPTPLTPIMIIIRLDCFIAHSHIEIDMLVIPG
jgi:hypothetical protein